MKVAANFVIGGIVFTGLIVGGAILGSLATYGLLEKEIKAGKEALANSHVREVCQKKAYGSGRYPWGSELHDINKSEETTE